MVNRSVGSELEPAGSNAPNVTVGKGSGYYQDRYNRVLWCC